MNEGIRCQCPEVGKAALSESWYLPEERKAMFHEPNACNGDYEVKLYRRGEEKLWLCSCCFLSSDVEIEAVIS